MTVDVPNRFIWKFHNLHSPQIAPSTVGSCTYEYICESCNEKIHFRFDGIGNPIIDEYNQVGECKLSSDERGAVLE